MRLHGAKTGGHDRRVLEWMVRLVAPRVRICRKMSNGHHERGESLTVRSLLEFPLPACHDKIAQCYFAHIVIERSEC